MYTHNSKSRRGEKEIGWKRYSWVRESKHNHAIRALPIFSLSFSFSSSLHRLCIELYGFAYTEFSVFSWCSKWKRGLIKIGDFVTFFRIVSWTERIICFALIVEVCIECQTGSCDRVNAPHLISIWHSKFKYPPLLCVFLFRFVRLFNKILKPVFVVKLKTNRNFIKTLQPDIRIWSNLCFMRRDQVKLSGSSVGFLTLFSSFVFVYNWFHPNEEEKRRRKKK